MQIEVIDDIKLGQIAPVAPVGGQVNDKKINFRRFLTICFFFFSIPFLKPFLAGSFSGTFSTVLFQPLDLVKTRLQNPTTALLKVESGVYGYNGVAAALKEIYRTEGIRGMTCGLVPTLFRDAPFSGLYLMFYTQAKLAVPEDMLNSPYASPIHFTCGVTAGILASIVTQPADVLKTKMQLYPNQFRGLWSVAVYVHSKYGIQGYFKGMVPRMLRRTLMAAMAWTVYEQISQAVGLK
ncbi:hypothetical protein NQ314_000605 [Rhamnusium bicolor]|uniref:Mitochondrial glycine transporter n=1 Tax=Rhamnusium bicolor TaxID=1586634 RepID=A0AAV8ZVN1_9CUCU|nr:hypothetical protein NQ314_000605 [Rhamnusium bicolor]